MLSYTYILIYRLTVFCRFLKNYTNSINCTYTCTACFITPLFLRYYYWKRYPPTFNYCKIFHLIIMPHFICPAFYGWTSILHSGFHYYDNAAISILLQVSCTWHGENFQGIQLVVELWSCRTPAFSTLLLCMNCSPIRITD